MRSSNLSLRPDKYLPAPCVSRKQGSPAKSTHPETGTLPTTSSFAPGPCSRYRRCRWIGRITFDIYLFLGCQAGYSVKSGVNIKIDEKMVQIVNMPEDQLLFDLALGLFVDNKVSLGQGARIIGWCHSVSKGIGRPQIPLHYGIEEFRRIWSRAFLPLDCCQ